MSKFKIGDIVRIKNKAYVSGSVSDILSPQYRVGVVVYIRRRDGKHGVFSIEDFLDNLSYGYDVDVSAEWLCGYQEDELRLLKRFHE